MSESGEDISKNVGRTSINHDRTVQLNISRAAMNAAQELSLVHQRGFTAKMRTWKWLFVNIYECDRLICIGAEILNWWLNGVNASICFGGCAEK
jgi:hypothetical protein